MNLFSLQSLSSSPVTSFMGIIVLILAVILLLWGSTEAKIQGAALIPVGAGLLAARQNNTTSEQAGAKPPL